MTITPEQLIEHAKNVYTRGPADAGPAPGNEQLPSGAATQLNDVQQAGQDADQQIQQGEEAGPTPPPSGPMPEMTNEVSPPEGGLSEVGNVVSAPVTSPLNGLPVVGRNYVGSTDGTVPDSIMAAYPDLLVAAQDPAAPPATRALLQLANYHVNG